MSDAKRSASRDRRFAAFALSCMMWTIKRFLITIETPDWKDVQDVELLRLPEVGETIETKYGTCLVTQTDASPGTGPYAGKIVCRMP
jgi:hypothetical protein